MNNFFKTFFAALLAFVVANILIFLVGMMIVGGFMASFSTTQTKSIKSGTVLKIDFAEDITDSPQSALSIVSSSLMSGSFSMGKSLSLLDALNAIEYAATDSNIEGIYINYQGPGNVSGTAQMEELRDAIVKFKESGKWVVSYNETYSQGSYWLCSPSDKIFVNPEGGLSWVGMASQVMFYKGLIDKLGVEVEVLRHGTYKSAVEPYITDRMSPANRTQMQTLVGSIWNVVCEDIAASRGIDVDSLNLFADELTISSPAAALQYRLVDDILYQDQVNDLLAAMVKGEVTDTTEVEAGVEAPAMISLGEYASHVAVSSRKVSKNKIAIIYADGQIVDGQSENGSIGSQTMVDKIAAARRDEGIKAVVLRVNSPGGSALASEIIWRELELLKAAKPVVVSMSNYAASGGYYISAPADAIIADRTTLTGSIGVFGLKFNAGRALKEKAGITVDVVKTNPSADLNSMFRSLTTDENRYMMTQIEDVYTTFVEHVSEGRNMAFDEVDAIGQGRVWSGADAAQIGLVDGFGTIKDAIALAADRASIADNYRVVESVDPQNDIFSMLLGGVSTRIAQARIQNALGEGFKYYQVVMQLSQQQGVQAMMPYFVEIQ